LTTHSHPNRNRWLIAIGVLKLLKAVLFVSMGFGVINLLHKDVADVLLRATTALRFDPENRFVNMLLEKSALLNPHRLKEISFAIFLYAALDIIEGTGLVLEKVWAEYFTLILTGSFLPWEFYEIIRHVTTCSSLSIWPLWSTKRCAPASRPSRRPLIKKDFADDYNLSTVRLA
jgi:uncharacterized membrane protein (DUF2068 family)